MRDDRNTAVPQRVDDKVGLRACDTAPARGPRGGGAIAVSSPRTTLVRMDHSYLDHRNRNQEENATTCYFTHVFTPYTSRSARETSTHRAR